MSKHTHTFQRRLIAAVALVGVVGAAIFSGQAAANTAAETTILNVVRVDYKDAGKTQSFAATASTKVTVNLVEAALTISPLVDQTVSSGASATYLYTLTAQANGSDVYDLAVTKGAVANVASDTVAYRTVAADGTTTVTSSPTSVTLGASVITAAPSATQLTFPGGTLTNISSGDVVVVNGNSYVVSAVTQGSGAAHSNLGNVAQSTVGADTAEVAGSLTLAIHAAGSNVAPNFTGAVVGMVAAEQVFLEVTSGATTTGSVDGTVVHTIETDSTNNATLASGVDNYASTSNTTTFTGTTLTITKVVRNVTQSGSFAATATGNPGEVLEYQVTVNNPGNGSAADVFITDAVPAYTALQLHTTYGDATPGTVFGTINDGTNTVALTDSAADSETQTGGATETGFGNTTGTAAGSTVTIYVGDTSTNALGGVVANTATYTILYRVEIQ